ncbi:MAG: DUF2232 domain-containing protein [Parvibaculum sp.]
MPPYLVIGVGAGVAGAILFLSAGFGSPLLGIPLFLAALPVFLAGLGWGSIAAGIAALTGFLILTTAASFSAGIAFVIADGFAPAWLSYLALSHNAAEAKKKLSPAELARLARKGVDIAKLDEIDEEPHETEWYPAGALIVWTAFVGAAVLVVAGLVTMIIGMESGIEGSLHMLLSGALLDERAIEAALQEMGLSADPQRILGLVSLALPAVAVLVWILTTLGTMWLAQFILVRAGQNLRPMPDLTQIELPGFLLGLLGGALILSFIPGSAAPLGGAITIALFVPYFMLGLAVIHAISRGLAARIAVLAVFYILLIFTGWLIVPVCLVGLLEPWTQLRTRFARAEAPMGEEKD